VSGYVAEKGDFKGEKPETEEAKKKALTGADIVVIPAGVPRTTIFLRPARARLTRLCREAGHDQR